MAAMAMDKLRPMVCESGGLIPVRIIEDTLTICQFAFIGCGAAKSLVDAPTYRSSWWSLLVLIYCRLLESDMRRSIKQWS